MLGMYTYANSCTGPPRHMPHSRLDKWPASHAQHGPASCHAVRCKFTNSAHGNLLSTASSHALLWTVAGVLGMNEISLIGKGIMAS